MMVSRKHRGKPGRDSDSGSLEVATILRHRGTVTTREADIRFH
jgi:hypothetical protein